jgi:hypothetical protein
VERPALVVSIAKRREARSAVRSFRASQMRVGHIGELTSLAGAVDACRYSGYAFCPRR